MTQVTAFVYCESIHHETTPSGNRQSIISPMMNLVPNFIPGNLSFAASIGLRNLDADVNHTLRYILRGPDINDQPVIDTGEFDFKFDEESNVSHVPKELRGVYINLDLRNVVFRVEGMYTSEVIINGDSMGLFPVPVFGKEKL